MKIIKFIVSIAIPLLVGFVGSLVTIPSIDSWYQLLNKPSFNPPNWIFSPVWTALFILMGISLFIIWINKNNSKAKRIFVGLFIIQLILNFLWSFIFFGWHSPFWALMEIILLLISIIALIISAGKISKASAWLLVPYLLWVGFATFLTFNIWMLNK
ncbi:MAG: TspO/MBR family protein [Candidatus Buchananbacteria bacterium]